MADIPNAQRYRQHNRGHRAAESTHSLGASRRAEGRKSPGQATGNEEAGPLAWIVAAGIALLALWAAK
jgi:hypothetical protein